MSATAYRRPGSEARLVRELAFDKLPRVVRERLIASISHGGAPAPLLVDAARRPRLTTARWLLLAGAAIAGEIDLWITGFGDALSPSAFHPAWYAALHVAVIFVVLSAIVAVARRTGGRGGGPVPDGRYLFPLDLVEAEGPVLRVTDLRTLRSVEAQPGRSGALIALGFADAHAVVFASQPSDPSLAATTKAAVDAAVALELPGDQPRVERIDPFFELRVADDWASAESAVNRPRSSLGGVSPAVLAAAIFLVSWPAGIGAHALRDRLSDDAMFAHAVNTGPRDSWDPWHVEPYTGTRHEDAYDALRLDRAYRSVDGLESYIRQGGVRIPEAQEAIFAIVKHDVSALRSRERLLRGLGEARIADALFDLAKDDPVALATYHGVPAYVDRADDRCFELARKSAGAAPYREYLRLWKRHADEVRSTLLPEAALREATTADDAGLLTAFAHDFPESPHATGAKAKSHALYADALALYRAKKPSADGLRFVTALFAEIEERGDPSVRVAVSGSAGSSVDAADTSLSLRFGSEYLPAGNTFTDAKMWNVEAPLRAALRAWIAASFAHGTVKPVDARRIEATAAEAPSILLTCEAIAEEVRPGAPEKFETPDVRFRLQFRGVVGARSPDLVWSFATRGASSGDASLPSAAAAAEGVRRRDVATESYDEMARRALAQAIERVERGL